MHYTHPVRHLAGDGFWQAFESNYSTPISRQIRVADIDQVFPRFNNGFQYLVAIPANCQLMREAIISRYFSQSLPIKNHQSTFTNQNSSSPRKNSIMAVAPHSTARFSPSTTNNAPPADSASISPLAMMSLSSTPLTLSRFPRARTTTPLTASPSARTTTGPWIGIS